MRGHLPPLILLLLVGCAGPTSKDGDDSGPGASEGEGEGEGEGETGNQADWDGDGYGWDDCDDQDPGVFPGATETCDGQDEDCDGDIDEDAADAAPFYEDADHDGYGSEDGALDACHAPDGYVAVGGDCDDGNPFAYPDAAEVCDDVDNDCDGEVDNLPVEESTVYADEDGDGYGDPAVSASGCGADPDYVDNALDCDDASRDINPEAAESCDHLDNDCDGVTDEGAVDASTFYYDADGDGYGDASDVQVRCYASDRWVADSADCDDSDAAIHPGADEAACDGVDDDCDGTESGARFELATGSSLDASEALEKGTADAPASYSVPLAGTLYLCPGTWYIELSVSADLDVVGRYGSDETTLSGGGAFTPISVEDSRLDLNLSGLTLSDGSGTTGGFLNNQKNNVDILIDDCVVSNNAGTKGGAIHTEGGTLTIQDSTFSGNAASGNGGAVHAVDTLVAVSGSTFHDNSSSDGYGGALYIGTSSYSGDTWGLIDDSEFADNSATQGGAIWVYYSGLEVSGSEIHGNSASYGGGVYTNYNAATFTDSALYENKAVYGGALYGYWGEISLDCSGGGGVWSNGSGTYGGGVYITYTGSVSSRSCDFGSGATENDTYDVVLGYSRLYTDLYGDDATFTCSGSAGSCY